MLFTFFGSAGASPSRICEENVRAARAEKSLESATDCGKVDAGRRAREKLTRVRFRLTVAFSYGGQSHQRGASEPATFSLDGMLRARHRRMMVYSSERIAVTALSLSRKELRPLIPFPSSGAWPPQVAGRPLLARMRPPHYNWIMSTITLDISDDLKEQLEELSRKQQRPASELVQDSLRRYIAVEQLKAIRRVTVPLAEAQGFLTDEDIFKAVS
jgi:predicted transcriptional regulator